MLFSEGETCTSESMPGQFTASGPPTAPPGKAAGGKLNDVVFTLNY